MWAGMFSERRMSRHGELLSLNDNGSSGFESPSSSRLFKTSSASVASSICSRAIIWSNKFTTATTSSNEGTVVWKCVKLWRQETFEYFSALEQAWTSVTMSSQLSAVFTSSSISLNSLNWKKWKQNVETNPID